MRCLRLAPGRAAARRQPPANQALRQDRLRSLAGEVEAWVERLPKVYLARVGSRAQLLATLERTLVLRSEWSTSVSEPIPEPHRTNRESIPKSPRRRFR